MLDNTGDPAGQSEVDVWKKKKLKYNSSGVAFFMNQVDELKEGGFTVLLNMALCDVLQYVKIFFCPHQLWARIIHSKVV